MHVHVCGLLVERASMYRYLGSVEVLDGVLDGALAEVGRPVEALGGAVLGPC